MHSKKIRIKNKITQKKKSRIRRIAALLCFVLTGGLYGCSDTGKSQKTELVSVQEAYQTETKGKKNDAGNTAEDAKKEQSSKTEKPRMYYVHVCGQVEKPGVYELPAGSRLYEALVLAGGLTENAAGEGLNQAEKIEDGSRVYVPSKEEYAASEKNFPGGSGEESPSGVADAKELPEAVADGKVNLNTATKEQLMTLSGIGEAKALAIISYRESHGNFQKIEELMQVEGIKNGVFQKVKDQIKV